MKILKQVLLRWLTGVRKIYKVIDCTPQYSLAWTNQPLELLPNVS